MRRPSHLASSQPARRVPAAVLALATITLVLPAAASDGGYPPPPGPYPFELAPVEPAEKAEPAGADPGKVSATARPTRAPAPRDQGTNLFGAPPQPRAPASPPPRPAAPAQPYRFQPYAAPGHAAPPVFTGPRPAAPVRPQPQARPQPQTGPRPSGASPTQAPAAAAPVPTAPDSSRSVLQTPDPMAGGSRFRPPEPGEAR